MANITVLIRNKKNIAFMVALASCLTFACNSPSSEYKIRGQITATHLSELSQNKHKIKRISIRSSGGSSFIAAQIGKIIHDYKIDVTIIDYCLSACFDIIAVAAPKLYAKNKPIIGVHGNPHVLFMLSVENRLQNCDIQSYSLTRQVYDDLDLNVRFSVRQMELLKFENYTIKGQCEAVSYDLEHELWFPTRIEIKEYLGKSIEGELCNDNWSCMERKYRHKRKESTCIWRDQIIAC